MKNKILVGAFLLSSFVLGNSDLNYDLKLKEQNTMVIAVVKGENRQNKNYYVIRGKESLEEIAHSHRIPLDELLRINNLKNSRDIHPGQILYFEENWKEEGEKNETVFN